MRGVPGIARRGGGAGGGWKASRRRGYHRRPAQGRRPACRSPPPPAAPAPPLFAGFAAAASLLLPDPAAARQDAPPSVAAESPGGNAILKDFNAVLDLAGPAGAKQKTGLNDLLNAFLPGVDAAAPIRVEALTAADPVRYRVIIPVDDPRAFETRNLNPAGIRVRRLANPRDVLLLGGVRGSAFDGYMKYLKSAGTTFAVIVEQQADLPEALVPPGRLLTKGDDAAFFLNNSADSPAAVAARWKRVDDAREELNGAVKKKSDETVPQFRLRRSAAGTQVTELGRFYAEAKQVLIRGSVPDGAIGGVTTLLYRPLPGTESAAALDRIGEAPSQFAGVPYREDAAFAGRTRFPLTDRQIANNLALAADMRAVVLEQAATATDPAEKAARERGWNVLFDAFEAVVKSGVVDAFARVEEVDGKQRVLGAFAVPEGAETVAAVEAFGKSRAGRAAERNVAEVGGVTLHRVTLGGVLNDPAVELLGGNEIWIGTAPAAFWYAGGPDARAELEKAIGEAGQTAEADDRSSSRLSADPGVGLRLLDELQLPDLFGEYRVLAEAALKTCDGQVKITLKKQDAETVVGKSILPRCVLTLMGRAIAKFSEDEKLAG